MACFLELYRSLGVWAFFTLSFLCHFRSNLEVSLLTMFSEAFLVIHICLEDFTLLDKRSLCRSFLDSPFPTPAFCWNSWQDPWVMSLVTSESLPCVWLFWPFNPSEAWAKGCPVTPLAFSPEHTLLISSFLISVSLQSGLTENIPSLQIPSLFT